MIYKINLKFENNQNSLYRLIGSLIKRKVNIEEINIKKLKNGLFFGFLIINTNKEKIDNLIKQINKIIEIIEVDYEKIIN